VGDGQQSRRALELLKKGDLPEQIAARLGMRIETVQTLARALPDYKPRETAMVHHARQSKCRITR
jgi:hypothetical protein